MWALDPVTMQSFDEFVDSYEDGCARGLTLSGESREYFARQRIAHTQRFCSRLARVGTVVDFGCGAGHAAPPVGSLSLRARHRDRLVEGGH
jgi:hypothetical protein